MGEYDDLVWNEEHNTLQRNVGTTDTTTTTSTTSTTTDGGDSWTTGFSEPIPTMDEPATDPVEDTTTAPGTVRALTDPVGGSDLLTTGPDTGPTIPNSPPEDGGGLTLTILAVLAAGAAFLAFGGN